MGIGWIAFLLLLASTGMVVAAEQSLPNEFLYPVKRVSEAVRVRMAVTSQDALVLRRSQEVKGLVLEGAAGPVLDEVLSEIQTNLEHQIETAPSDHQPVEPATTPSTVTESVTILKETREQATEPARQKIDDVLLEINKVQKEKDKEKAPSQTQEILKATILVEPLESPSEIEPTPNKPAQVKEIVP